MEFVDLQTQRRLLRARLDERLDRVFSHARFIMGPEVSELESALAAFTGAGSTITCGSGTDALLMPLLAWGVKPGDAVFVPSFTFSATAEMVRLAGAHPVFVDVDDTSLTMAPRSLDSAIDTAEGEGLTPKAIIPVDLFGHPADYPALSDVAASRGLPILADAAQSLGATTPGGSVGSLAHVTATSFFPSKPLGCYGDGGAIFTDDPELADVLRSLRVHGQGSNKYDNVRIGINGRLDTLQAAVLLVKLEVFDDELRARRELARFYSEVLAGTVQVPTERPGVSSAWAQYTIRTNARDRLAQSLKEAGIPTAIYYPKPLHLQPAYAHDLRDKQGLEVSERLAQEVLSLPMHPYLSHPDRNRIAEVVNTEVSGTGS